MRTRLALFDCDGTLADSQHAILSAMRAAFTAHALPAPPDAAIRRIIGLSIGPAVEHLAPDLSADRRDAVATSYRDAYFAARTAAGSAPEPLFDGIPDMIDQLHRQGWLLGVATGKSQRGLTRLLNAHGLTDRFVTLQTADFHPSKPHPAMALAAIAEAGVDPADTVVIGDTAFDMRMARDAGARALGVAWGYHATTDLTAAGADAVASAPADIAPLLTAMMERL